MSDRVLDPRLQNLKTSEEFDSFGNTLKHKKVEPIYFKGMFRRNNLCQVAPVNDGEFPLKKIGSGYLFGM